LLQTSAGNGTPDRACVPLARWPGACHDSRLATRLAIDDRLLDEAHAISGLKTKTETLNQALREYIQRRKQLEILKLSGKVDFDPAYDFKRQCKS